MMKVTGGALDGVRILELTTWAAGPYAGFLLSSLGAEIIKIEPLEGDGIRPFSFGHYFPSIGANKRSITLNLESEKGRKIFQELVKQADVVTENFAGDKMKEWGLGYDALSAINPKLIYAFITGFGRTGPYAGVLAYDTIIQAMAGVMSCTGQRDNPPTMAGIAVADYTGGVNLAAGILAALYHREKTGKGQIVEVSMQDAIFAFLKHQVATFLGSGKVTRRTGNSVRGMAPCNAYATKDGYVMVLAATGKQWTSLLKAMGKEDWMGREDMKGAVQRVKFKAEIDAMIADWAKTKTKEEAFAELDKWKVPCGKVLDESELLNDPHLLMRGTIAEIDQPGLGKTKIALSPIRLSASSAAIGPAPGLGQHNEEVYSQFLGYSKEEILSLKEEGVV